MALHYELEKIEGFKELCYIEDGKNNAGEPMFRVHPVTEALIFSMMNLHVGGEITQANHEEVFRRLYIMQELHGAWLRNGDGTERFISLEDVKNHIGLWTNCFGDKGKRPFKEKVMTILFRQADSRLKQQKEEIKNGVEQMEEAVNA